jgi:hypothetical protein
MRFLGIGRPYAHELGNSAAAIAAPLGLGGGRSGRCRCFGLLGRHFTHYLRVGRHGQTDFPEEILAVYPEAV